MSLDLSDDKNSAASNAALQQLLGDYLREKKFKRWLRIGYFILFIIVLISIFSTFSKEAVVTQAPHSALVELNGVIGVKGGVMADQIAKSLAGAFAAKHSRGVILKINSPGGSPVQSDDINKTILRLKKKYPKKPLYVVMTDLAASGGYFVAVAADEIYANRSSIVGSIGVRMDSFGFVKALDKLGVERRSMTAGENKAILDPFLPTVPKQQKHIAKMLNQVHQHFIETVKEGRGDKLSDDPNIFSGLFWSGEEAKRLGLIDGFNTVQGVARDVIGEEKIVDYTYKPDIFAQLTQYTEARVASLVTDLFEFRLR